MSYVAAGYAICLGVLCLYAASLVLRRRRLERASAVEGVPAATGVPATGLPAPGGSGAGGNGHGGSAAAPADTRRPPGGVGGAP